MKILKNIRNLETILQYIISPLIFKQLDQVKKNTINISSNSENDQYEYSSNQISL